MEKRWSSGIHSFSRVQEKVINCQYDKDIITSWINSCAQLNVMAKAKEI